MNKARRPLSSAASFFRSDGKKKESSPSRHESLSHPVTGISRPGLSASEAEKLELFDLFPTLVEYVRQNGLGEEGLFMKDPSAQTQEAMMGLAAGTPRIQVRALRRLLDARPEEREGVLNEFDVHVWAGGDKGGNQGDVSSHRPLPHGSGDVANSRQGLRARENRVAATDRLRDAPDGTLSFGGIGIAFERVSHG